MTLPTSAHLGTHAPALESVAPDSASIDGRLDRLARGSAFGALLLLALALLALGFTSHHSDEALDAIAPPFDIDRTASARVAPALEVP